MKREAGVPRIVGRFAGAWVPGMLDRIQLKSRHAAELIKSMGGGEVIVTVNEHGRVSVVAVCSGDRTDAQKEAERLLAYLQRRYEIVLF